MQSWKDVLPGDHYIVRTGGLLHFYHQKVVTCLYQPLIELEASGLYFTLWQEGEGGAGEQSLTHHHLMAVLNLPLNRLLAARKKLEALGLLRTLKKKAADPAFFIYELEPPLSPARFFQDDVLAPFLYHQLGQRDYERTREQFERAPLPVAEFEDVSAAFAEVYGTRPSGEQPPGKRDAYADETAAEPHFHSTFNFQALSGYLSAAIVSAAALTPQVREVVAKLAFVYQIDPYNMSRALETAALHTGDIDIEALRREVRDFYALEHGPGEEPALVMCRQPAGEREMDGRRPQGEEEVQIAWYESISPYQLLEALGDGAKPAATDLKLVESLLLDLKLNPGVVNVLIDYVVKVNDNHLTKAFVESIAATWARAHVRTVRQAMTIARQEKRKRDALKQQKPQKHRAAPRSAAESHREIIPEWMNKKKESAERPQVSPEEAEKRAKWLDDYLNNI
ncbi:MAG: DnaD domain protein [Sporolactobacillus sp.]